MATVTGITVDRAQEIEDASVVSGHISGSNLYLVTHGGAEINAGAVVPPAPTPISAWPVGSIYMTTNASNPSTLLGGGTWVRWGQGRVPVSQDSSQTEFDAVEEIGGEKTHTLTVGEMPSHNHGGSTGGRSAPHSHQTNVGPSFANGAAGSGIGNVAAFINGATTLYDEPDHSHAIPSQGGGAAMNNLQPYITCYMWKRTA